VSEPIIRAEGLTKRFGEFVAVDDLRLSVERGSIFAFLGANGSGKSTTMRMLIGLLTPTAGKVFVDGVDVIANPRRVRDHVGYMGQKVSLYQGLSLRENIEFYGGLYGLGGPALDTRWGELRERFDLAAAEGERPENLPAGLRQRAGLALSVLHAPQLLFLDEPTAGVDVFSRSLFWDLIRETAESGVTVFVTTHFLEEADYCDWVSFIDAGRLIADAAPEDLRARYSDGYRLVLAAPPGERPALSAALAATGLAPEPCAEGVMLRSRVLDDGLLGRVERALGSAATGSLRVEQAPMNEVFRRLILESQAARAGAGT
jgi:ABC-2 type transport system ATP-binding protein